MATFLSNHPAHPPPGRRSLLQQRDDNQHTPIWRHDRQRHLHEFLAREEGGVPVNDPAPNEAGKTTRSFLKNYEEAAPLAAGAEDLRTTPRTIANGTLLSHSTGANDPEPKTLAKPPSQHILHNSTPDTKSTAPAYTTGKTASTVSTDAMAGKSSKPVPPHLKKKTEQPSEPPYQKDNNSPGTSTDIHEKLSKLGVSVSAPKPATAKTTNTWGSTEWAELLQPSRNDETRNNDRGAARGGRGRGRGRGGGRGRGSDAPRSTRWPKKSEFPPVDPKAHETNWHWETTPVPQEKSWPSTAGGWDDEHQDQGGAPLGGWDNSWAPAPLNWESRSAFRSGQSVENVEKWLRDVGEAADMSLNDFETVEGVTYTFATSDGSKPDNPNTKYQLMGDLVPRSWMPQKMEALSPQLFWQSHTRSDNPQPDDGIDLSNTRPWWELVVRGGTFLRETEQPPSAINPREENADQRMKRECDKGSWTHAQNRRDYELKKAAAKEEKRRMKENSLSKLRLAPIQPVQEHKKFRPSTDFKLLVRPAHESDMRDCRDIYNFYVDNSCVVPEDNRVTVEDMLTRFGSIENSDLPFLVACEPGGVMQPRRKKNSRRVDDGEPFVLPDKVVGFAYAEDCDGTKDHAAVEVKIFVRATILARGVGKCLMDKLMAMLDLGYRERGSYAVSEELQHVSPEHSIQSIVINLRYDNPGNFNWKADWLENWLGFSLGEGDHLEGVGTKNNRSFNLATFRRPTAIAT